MKKFLLSTSRGKSEIFLGKVEEGWARIKEISRAPLIVDEKLCHLVPHLLQGKRYMTLSVREKDKSLLTVMKIYHQFLEWRLDRSSLVIILGGGVLSDLAAFSCSTYMRGINYLITPTTFLAQADASLGGKNGLNFAGIKNIIGTFSLPQAIVIDPGFLKTLPSKEIRNGLAEVIKHALIASRDLLAFIEEKWPHAINYNPVVLKKMVEESIKIKINIVSQDINEENIRRVLNFGHTFAHALEKILGLAHGEAVAWGMDMATRLSRFCGLLVPSEASRIQSLLGQIFPQLHSIPISKTLLDEIFQKIQQDKKKAGGKIHFVFLKGIGQPEIRLLSLTKLKRLTHDLCQLG